MENRKEMVKVISEFTGLEAKYLGVPSCAYQIGKVKVLKDGTLEFAEGLIYEEALAITNDLKVRGFALNPKEMANLQELKKPETVEEAESKDEPQQIALTIQLPKVTFTPEAIENLNNLLIAKGALIQKALGLESLPEVEDEGDNISFPWFKVEPNGVDMVEAYGKLVCALCDMARNQKRVTAKEQHPTNEKYAFRCFLLRLGFIGPECKKTRKALLENLSGSSAWKDGAKHENA